jgi:hypothetical protein
MPATKFTDEQLAIARTYLPKFQEASKSGRAAVIQETTNAVLALNPSSREKDKKELKQANETP